MTRCGFSEVGHVIDDRQSAEQFGGGNKVIHPGATILVITFEVIAIPKRERFAVGIEYLEHAHIRLVHGNVFAFFEGEPGLARPS